MTHRDWAVIAVNAIGALAITLRIIIGIAGIIREIYGNGRISETPRSAGPA